MDDDNSHVNVLTTFLPPALWLFVLPIIAVVFSAYTIGVMDGQLIDALSENIATDTSMSAADKAEALEQVGWASMHVLCTDPTFADDAAAMADVCSDVFQLVWLGRLGLISVLLGLFTMVGAGAMAALAWSRTDQQVLAFRLGWNLMRITSALQAVLQGVLVVGLSFWLTAWFFSVYFVKLILLAAVIAAGAVWTILVAIFTRPDLVFPIEGALLTEERAPELWARVRHIAQAIGTAPPDRIVAGIDDNFFVTEGTISHGGVQHTGRTLYVSLSLLRVMSQDQADAVLAHEMAHYAGGDTAVSAQLVPMQARYRIYLQALSEGAISLPIFHSMHAFYALFEMARAKSSREREYRADAAAAAHTSADAIGGALVRVGAYASYRGRVERSLFEQNEQLSELGIAGRVASGFVDYAQGGDVLADLNHDGVPHPFDSHPPTHKRIEAVGSVVKIADAAELLAADPVDPWTNLIPEAAELEAGMWADYERKFAEAHEQMLAWRYLPSTDEEKAHVLKYFPGVSFTATKGDIHISYDRIHAECWADPVMFEDLEGVEVVDTTFTKAIRFSCAGGTQFDIPRKGIDEGEGAVLEALNLYWQRHQVAHNPG